MSIETMAVVLHHSKAAGTDKLVLLGIANHDGDGGAWPAVSTLSTYANVAPRTVQRSLSRLVELGELTVERQAGGTADRAHYERPNLYHVTVTCPPECDRSTRHRLTDHPPEALWINPLTPTSPPDAHVTRGGDAHVTQTTHSTNTTNHPSASVTGPRASCSVCSLPAEDCIRRARTSGHAYRAQVRDPAAVVAKIRAQYDDVLPPREDSNA